MLACMSGPINTQLQYRYDKKLFAPNVITSLQGPQKGRAIVCFIDTTKRGICPIIPVREVTIQNITQFGSSVALNLKLDEFALSPNDLSPEFQSMNIGELPEVTEEGTDAKPSKGFLVYEISSYPKSLTVNSYITTWEKTITRLHLFEVFKDQRFFFHTPALYDGTVPMKAVIDKTASWPDKLSLNKVYTLAIIIFHPKKDSGEVSKCQIKINSTVKTFAFNPEDMEVDSLYDIRFWTFKIIQENMLYEPSGWLTIGPINKEVQLDPLWHLVLPFKLNRPYLKLALVMIVLGLLISSPATIAFWNREVELIEKIYATIMFVGFGIATAVAATIGIKKVT